METRRGKTIGIIMTYNCAHLVEDTYRRIPKNVFDEIFIVDDGSRDTIQKVARRLRIPFYPHQHMGYGGNIKYGLQKAIERGAEYMVEIHGDGQYDVSFIPEALKVAKQGYHLLLGSRFKHALQDHMPPYRYLANYALSLIDRIVLGVPLTEFHTGFRVYTKELVERVSFEGTSDDFIYSFEIIAQARYYGLKVGEIPIRCDFAKEHTSMNLKKSILYSLQTFPVLFWYSIALFGFENKLFHKRKKFR